MFLRFVLAPLLAVALVSGTCTQAYAGVITTQQALSAEVRSATEQEVRTALARDDVRQAMQQLGVNPLDVDARIASLSDAELMQLQGEIDQLQAGGILAVIGVVFVVLLILELVGVTNIFSKV
ncbi:PA2779 family protein [Pseudoxanthomonas mexicana]|uniref:PA2779 family protein n=1 Tax=Pseudoxanthomonas mexicana TaxID=128785 RepID=UPI00398A8D98